MIDVDGVRITYVDHNATELNADARKLTDGTDVLIVGPAQQAAEDERATSATGQLVESRILVAGSDDRSNGNTVAVSTAQLGESKNRRTVLLGKQPLTLPTEMEQLMAAKEASCTASQKVFAEPFGESNELSSE